MKPCSIVLVDFSNLAYCCYFPALVAQKAGEKALAEHKEKCAACEIGMDCSSLPRTYSAEKVLKVNLALKLDTLEREISNAKKSLIAKKSWIMVKDGTIEKKKALYPNYKGDRKHDFDPKPIAEEFIKGIGCRFVWSPEAEADDAIATMASDLNQDGVEVIIVSSDADLWTLYSPPQVRIYLLTQKEWLTTARIEKKFRVKEPRLIPLCKSLWGDASDCIPNVAPHQQKKLLPIIQSGDGSLADFRSKGGDARVKDVNQMEVNYKLVTLDKEAPIEWL